MKKYLLTFSFLLISFFSIAQSSEYSSPSFTKKDSLKCDILQRDWRGNLYKHFKIPDTSIIQIKIFNEQGYMQRIKAYKLVWSERFIVADGDNYYINVKWEDDKVEYLTLNKKKIKDSNIDKYQ